MMRENMMCRPISAGPSHARRRETAVGGRILQDGNRGSPDRTSVTTTIKTHVAVTGQILGKCNRWCARRAGRCFAFSGSGGGRRVRSHADRWTQVGEEWQMLSRPVGWTRTRGAGIKQNSTKGLVDRTQSVVSTVESSRAPTGEVLLRAVGFVDVADTIIRLR